MQTIVIELPVTIVYVLRNIPVAKYKNSLTVCTQGNWQHARNTIIYTVHGVLALKN